MRRPYWLEFFRGARKQRLGRRVVSPNLGCDLQKFLMAWWHLNGFGSNDSKHGSAIECNLSMVERARIGLNPVLTPFLKTLAHICDVPESPVPKGSPLLNFLTLEIHDEKACCPGKQGLL